MREFIVLLILYWPLALFAADDLEAAQKAINAGDYAVAYCLLKPMADNNHAIAQFQLGWMYHSGYGLAVNDSKAAELWENAAKGGVADAQLALVMLYREGGVGIEKDFPKAAEYLVKSVVSGDEEARLLMSHYMDDQQWQLKKYLSKILRTRPEQLGQVFVVNRDKTNLRAAPTTASKVVETVDSGEKLVQFASRGEWSHVVHVRRRDIVWVHSALIEKQ